MNSIAQQISSCAFISGTWFKLSTDQVYHNPPLGSLTEKGTMGYAIFYNSAGSWTPCKCHCLTWTYFFFFFFLRYQASLQLICFSESLQILTIVYQKLTGLPKNLWFHSFFISKSNEIQILEMLAGTNITKDGFA